MPFLESGRHPNFFTLKMSQSQPKPSLSDRLGYASYRIFEYPLKLAPVKLLCFVGMGLGTIAYYLLKGRRQTVIRNLRIAFSEKMSHPEILKLTKKTFQHSGANLIASLRTSFFSEQQLFQHVEFIGAENLETEQRQSAGLIILLAHMGNWELMAHIHLALPSLCPPATLYRPIDNPLIDNLIKRRRSSEGTTLFSRRDGFFKPISHIKSGGSLGLLADQHAGAHGLAIPFFGKLTSMTNLPAIIHRRTGAAILPISMESTTVGNWRVTIHPVVDIPTEKKADTLYISMLCAKAYETIMRTNPADVFWMHGYWKTGRKGPLKIDGLQKRRVLGTQRALATQPFRVIVYTGSARDDAQEMVEQLHRLKNYRPDLHLTTVGEYRIFKEGHAHIPATNSTSLKSRAKTLNQYDLNLPTPIDCALDFTTDCSGGELFDLAKFSHVFSMYGKYQGRKTATFFAEIDHPNLTDFLNSLGIQD